MTILYDLPAHEYHAMEGLGSTSIKTLADPEISLHEARYLLDHNEHKVEYDVGTLAHALILEGSLDDLVVRVHADSWRTKAAKEARDEAYAAGLIPVNDAEVESILDPVERMRDAVMSDPIAAPLLTGHLPEVSILWERDDVKLKARIDAWHPSTGTAVDLKTVRSARPNDVRKQISDLGYYQQARHYISGLELETGRKYGDDLSWYFVTVQKTEPYTVSVHTLTDMALADAQLRIDYALDRYKDGIESGWGGYGRVFEQELTTWESMKNEELDDVEIEVKVA